MMAIFVVTIEVEGAVVGTATRLQQVESVPPLGRTWMCARIRDALGTTHAGLKGSVTRVAHAHGNETPNVIEFKASMTRQDLSTAYLAALKEAGWQFDPAIAA